VTRKYFGTDGIRDVAGEGLLAPDRVLAYGRAFGRYVASKAPGGRVLVGRDTRDSGPGIVAALADGLTACGLEVVDGGVLTTPAVQTLCREEKFDSAIIVSASHNPAEDNGIKFLGPDGRKLPDDAEAAVERLIDEAPATAAGAPRGKVSSAPELEARYLDFMREQCFPSLDLRGRTIVLDCAHGAASHLGPRLLDLFGARVFVFHAQPDGTNINHNAGVFHVANLRDAVELNGPAIAVALDGDADRALFLDETGEVRDGDHVLGLLAEDLHRRKALPGGVIVTTVMANLGLAHFLRRIGIRQEVVPVGDRYVAAKMEETGAALGGEQSGHVIFREGARWFGDGLYTALRVLDVMARSERTLRELTAGVEKYPQLIRNVPVRRKLPPETVPPLLAAIREAEAALGSDGRVVVRYSGTESIFRVMIEGRVAATVAALAERIASAAAQALG
jgi:phosphoglucosamine mutase